VLPVTRLCECWQSAVETVTARQRTLESMLVDSRQFEQLYVDTDRWIVQTSQRCLQDDIGNDVATVKQQKDIVEVITRSLAIYVYESSCHPSGGGEVRGAVAYLGFHFEV